MFCDGVNCFRAEFRSAEQLLLHVNSTFDVQDHIQELRIQAATSDVQSQNLRIWYVLETSESERQGQPGETG